MRLLFRFFWFIVGYWIAFRYNISVDGRPRVVGFPVIKNRGSIIFGEESTYALHQNQRRWGS